MRCCPSPERWARRAQVWLGTLVEVALPPAEATDARFTAAFDAIRRVHQCMSAHDPASDLARIARHAHQRGVRVARETYAVLELAQELAQASRGQFDVSKAPVRAWGRCIRGRTAAPRAGLQALHLQPGRRVRTEHALGLDLSGIAKGHAVDCAVEALRRSGARAGLVNAGGDLRVFGVADWMPVRVRLPRSPTLALPLFEVRDAAVATSADYFREGRAALFDPHRRRMWPFTGSVSVVAPSCALADALTKIVALRPERAAALLARYRAHAFRIDAAGLDATTTLHAPTAHLRFITAAVA